MNTAHAVGLAPTDDSEGPLQGNKRYWLTRRNLCLCGLAAAAAATMPVSPAEADETGGFLCGTLIPPLPEDVALQSAEKDDGGFVPGIAGEGVDASAEGESVLSPQGAARAALKWLPSDGLSSPAGVIRLGVGFVDVYEEGWRNEVIRRSNLWLPRGSDIARKLQFDFTVPLDQCRIRISQTGIGPLKPENKSLVGRKAIANRLEDGKSTMYIYNLTSVEHEFGHALCLTHEHQHEAIPVTIDREKAIAYYAKEPNNWTRSQTISNVLGASERCTGDPGWNATSVMGYTVPPEITVEGIGLYPGKTINARDRKCIDAIYLRT